MICARVIYPNVKDTDAALIHAGRMPAGNDYRGRHTIAAWGFRLGRPKLHEDITDWSVWTPEMHERCIGDTKTNVDLWDHLQVDKYSQAAIELEHEIAVFCDSLEEAGVPFDQHSAHQLHIELTAKMNAADKKLRDQFGSWLAPISPTPSRSVFTPKKTDSKRGYTAGAPFTKLKRVFFNPGSRDNIAKVLTDRGWKPDDWTEGGKPRIDENIVAAIVSRFPEMDGLAEFLMIDKRLSQLADGDQAWLKVVKEDGRIHGVVNPMGTTTSRATHFWPNLAQVPAGAAPYGKECRSLFGVRHLNASTFFSEPWALVGADQEGLELRGFAHYLKPLDGGRYETLVLKGDPHWANTQAMGFTTEARDKNSELHTVYREVGAKRFIYAFIYGCGDYKAGEIVLDTCVAARKLGFDDPHKHFFGPNSPSEKKIKQVGRGIRQGFLTKTAGLGQLKLKLGKQIERFGWLPGLDGRRIPVRSEHSALNFLIQSAGAILCKRWIVDAVRELQSMFKQGWDGDFVPILWVHDEIQIACKASITKQVGEVLVKHAQKAGETYGFRVRLDSKFKVGETWSDTH
jgi:DNA polymerase-1